MLMRLKLSALVMLVVMCFSAQLGHSAQLPDLPVAVSNNAVAASMTKDGPELYSFAGLLSGKTWQDVTDKAWWLPAGSEQWQSLPPVPGDVG